MCTVKASRTVVSLTRWHDESHDESLHLLARCAQGKGDQILKQTPDLTGNWGSLRNTVRWFPSGCNVAINFVPDFVVCCEHSAFNEPMNEAH